MTREELAKVVAKKSGLTSRQAEGLIFALGDTITDALEHGDKVVYSNFGTFYTVHYPSKVIIHPRLGEAKKMIMLPTNVAKWMPSPNIKEMVNRGIVAEGATTHGKKKAAATAVGTTEPLLEAEPSAPSQLPMIQETAPAMPTVDDSKPINTSAPLEHSPDLQADSTPPEHGIEIPISTFRSKPQITPKTLSTEIAPPQKPFSIFEEKMQDGSTEEATFDGVIRLHDETNKPFWKRFFNQKKVAPVNQADSPKDKNDVANNLPETKVSLLDAGIFDKTTATTMSQSLPAPAQSIHQSGGRTSFSQAAAGSPVPALPQSVQPNTVESSAGQNASSIPKIPSETTGLNELTFGDDEKEELTPFSIAAPAVKYVDLSKMVVPKEILQQIPEKLARSYMAVPIEEQDDKLTIAMIDPEDIEAKELIKKQVQKPITVCLAAEADINHILDQYQGLESEVQSAIEDVDDEQEEIEEQQKTEEDAKDLVEAASDDAPAARIVHSVLRRAIRDKASDLHIEPLEKEIQVRFRLDGILHKKVSLPKDVQSAIVSRIKILANLKIDEQRLPQDGRFSIHTDNRRVDFRVSTMPTAFGEKVVIRILDKMSGILTIEQLGMDGSGLLRLQNSLTKSHGMILVTGPTGSGKTTTLYALIDKLFAEGVNIVTLEDPIEYQMPGINQSQVNAEINYTFANGLRSIVRQDPDIVMIGEIRDGETAEMAVQAALTGHIVLSTLHTNDAAGAAPRLIDMGVEPFLLTSSINLVIGQRLARKICDDCKEEISVPEAELEKIQQIIKEMPAKEKAELASAKLVFYHGKGCKTCNDTGYKGRIGIFEALEVTEEVKQLVLQKVSSSQINQRAIGSGMVTMIQDGIIKALKGLTSLEEVWRVTKD